MLAKQNNAQKSASTIGKRLSVAQRFYNHALIIFIIIITVIIITIIIIITKLVTFPIYLSFCIQTPLLLHEFLWGARQGKRKLNRTSANEDKQSAVSKNSVICSIKRAHRRQEFRMEARGTRICTNQITTHSSFPAGSMISQRLKRKKISQRRMTVKLEAYRLQSRKLGKKQVCGSFNRRKLSQCLEDVAFLL